MRRKLTAAFLGAVLVLTTAGACPGSETPAIEVEDCDAEDYRNKEAECGFTDADRKKTPAVKPPAKAPAKPPAKPPTKK